MASLSLIFDILARDNASGALRNVGNAAGRTGQQMNEAEGHAGRLGGAMGKLGDVVKVAGLAFAGIGIADFLSQSVKSLERIERINAQTTAVIKSTGEAAGVSAQHIFDLTGNLENLTATEAESTQQGANLLLTFTNIKNGVGANNDIFDQAVTTMTDMTRALDTTGGANLDASKTALQLGKALNDPIKGMTALQRVGVSFTQTQKDQVAQFVQTGDLMSAQKVILAELTKEFGGAGEAFARTTAGKVELAKHALGTFGETITGFVLPALAGMASEAAVAFNAMADGFSSGEVKSKGFKGVMEQVGVAAKDIFGAIGDLASTIGRSLAPALNIVGPALGAMVGFLGDIASVIGSVAGWFSDLPGPIKAGALALGGFLLLRGPLDAMLTSLTLKYLAFGSTVIAEGGLVAAATAGLKGAASGLLGVLGGPWGLAITGVTIGLGFLVQWLTSAGDATDKSAQQSEAAAQANKDFAAAIREANGAITDNVKQSAAKAAQDAGLLDSVEATGLATTDVTDALLGNDAAYQRVSGSLKAYAEQQRLLAVGATGEEFKAHTANAEAAERQLGVLQQLSGQMPDNVDKEEQLARATGEGAGAAGGATLAMQQLQQQLQDTSDSASDGRKQIDLLKTSLDVLTGDGVSMIEVQSALNDAIDASTDAIKAEGGAVLDAAGSLNTHTENGRAAADVLLDVRNRGNDLIATMIQQGATTEQVTAADADLRQSFINTAKQMGIGEAAANALADQILGIPASRTTTITADTGQATRTIDSFIQGINGQGLIGIIRTIGGKKDGGYITGPGTGRSDSILSHLSNGEFVVNAASTAKHRPLLEAINSAPKFADGGYVNYPSDADFVAFTDMTAAAKGKLQNAFSGLPGPGGAVQRWAGLVTQVLGLLGQPGSLVGAVLQLIQHESGGNPNAINLTDSNAKAGHPSQGLMQTIPGTFNAYAGPYRSLGITNPLANIYAGLNYGIHRYGSVSNIPGIRSLAQGGKYLPYDNGGLLMPGLTMAYNGTGKPETVRTAEQEAALGGGRQIVLQLDGQATTDLLEGRAVAVVTDYADAVHGRSVSNP